MIYKDLECCVHNKNIYESLKNDFTFMYMNNIVLKWGIMLGKNGII